MKNVILISILSTLLGSCATILNQPTTNVRIFTNEPSEIIVNSDTFRTKKNIAQITAKRSTNPLKLTVINQTSNENLTIEAKNSLAYKMNILFSYGIGLLVDRDNIKRYDYPRKVYYNTDGSGTWSTFDKSDKSDDINIRLSLPYVNSLNLKPSNESRKINTGFWGLTVGLDYYHKQNQFLNLSASAVMDLFVPIPVSVDISGQYELMSSKYLSLSNNHRHNRWTFGYGMAYGTNSWDLRYYDRFDPLPPSREPVKKSHQFIGTILSTYFYTGEHFSIGLLYRPSILKLEPTTKLEYEHFISLDFGWTIKMK